MYPFICCCFSVTQSCLNIFDPMDCSTPGFTTTWTLLKLMSIELMMPSNHLIFCRPLLLLPLIFSSIQVFFNESVSSLHQEGNFGGFSFSIRSSTEYSGLISFRVDWFDLLPVQGTLNSFLQHHIWKASNLWCSVFFYVLTLKSVRDYWKKHPFIYLPYIKCFLCIEALANLRNWGTKKSLPF